MKRTRIILTLCVCLTAFASLAQTGNIDLATVPTRESVQLTIYNAEDLTLVRETRVLTFKQGDNPLQFSWANTLIDPTSVQLRFLSRADELSLLDTTFPHAKRQMLYWNVNSEFEGEATVEISYFTSGITWSADYLLNVAPDEASAGLAGYVTVTNNSGEDYENAQVRLVVGRINLVEQIAELARRGVGNDRQDAPMDALRPMAARQAFARAEMLESQPAMAPSADMPKQIVKQGLSEYFIFTVEGRETVPNGWAKRMESFAVEAAPLRVEYRYRPEQYGPQLVRMLLLKNDTDSELGTSPLPDGRVTVYARNANPRRG